MGFRLLILASTLLTRRFKYLGSIPKLPVDVASSSQSRAGAYMGVTVGERQMATMMIIIKIIIIKLFYFMLMTV